MIKVNKTSPIAKVAYGSLVRMAADRSTLARTDSTVQKCRYTEQGQGQGHDIRRQQLDAQPHSRIGEHHRPETTKVGSVDRAIIETAAAATPIETALRTIIDQSSALPSRCPSRPAVAG